ISLQLLKVDRYTGISVLESGLMTEQVTTYFSPEATLLALLGAASSFMSTSAIGGKSYMYFLTFSPGQVSEILSDMEVGRDPKRYLILRDQVKSFLGDVLAKYPSNELLVTELLLNIELSSSLVKNALEKVDFLLFKVAMEGNTYKIYESLPLSLVRRPPFYNIPSIEDPDALREMLWRIVDPSSSLVIQALDSLTKKRQRAEASNILRAVLFLHRFVTLGDALGLKEFLRELAKAHTICRANKGKDCDGYLRHIARLSRSL
ncbi:MAG: hypothetical protein J7L91_05350, partial [Candidatus Korarchaeota archaeon]|nr:hypothetical protein [Candidatus Korarchaeota archaeon]